MAVRSFQHIMNDFLNRAAPEPEGEDYMFIGHLSRVGEVLAGLTVGKVYRVVRNPIPMDRGGDDMSFMDDNGHDRHRFPEEFIRVIR